MARYVRNTSGLVRQLKWWDVLFITLAAPTGSGILFYSVQTSGQPGGSIAVAFAVGMLLFLPMVLSSSILATAMPRSGGPYVAISRLVHPALGYLASCLLILGDGIIIGVLGFILMEIGGAMLSVVGQAYKMPGLASFGQAAGATPWAPIGAVLWVVLFWILMLQPPRVFRRLLTSLLLLPLLTTVLTIAIFAMTSAGEAAGSFNALWGPQAWDRVLQAATAAGWHAAPFSWNASLSLLLVVVWAFNGIEFASYVGGEVQAPQQSYRRGLLLGWLGVGTLYMLIALAVNHSFGDIAQAYHFLQANHPEKLAEIMPAITPSIPFYLLCIIRSPVLGVLLAIAFVCWFVKIIPTIFLTSSRLMFALAMDRLVPEKLADVNPRTTAPTWATHLTAGIALVGALFYFLKVNTVLGTLMFCTMFMAWPMGLALILLPLRQPELVRTGWFKSPRILGLPAGSWFGVVALLAGLILLYLAGRAIPLGVWAGLLAVAALLLGNYVVRARRARSFVEKGEEAALLPPE